MESSGMTQQQWCDTNNINYSTMREMKYRLAKEGCLTKTDTDTDWVRLNTPTPKATISPGDESHLEIRFGSMTVTIQVKQP